MPLETLIYLVFKVRSRGTTEKQVHKHLQRSCLKPTSTTLPNYRHYSAISLTIHPKKTALSSNITHLLTQTPEISTRQNHPQIYNQLQSPKA
jgi:hypothetical protein